MRRSLALLTLLPIALAAHPVAADDEGIHAQVSAGFGAYLLHDEVTIDGRRIHLDDDAFTAGPVPPLLFEVGASFMPWLSIELALSLRFTRMQSDDAVSRHDSSFWASLRAYPLRTERFAPFVELGGGISTRSIVRDSTCFIACDDRRAATPEVTRPMLAAAAGTEWYPGESGFHVLSRLALEAALEIRDAGPDLWLDATVGVGWRWR